MRQPRPDGRRASPRKLQSRPVMPPFQNRLQHTLHRPRSPIRKATKRSKSPDLVDSYGWSRATAKERRPRVVVKSAGLGCFNMGVFAWRNLLTRPLRTVLALIGLSVPILGVMGLFSVSNGLRNLVGETLSQIEGVMVIRENVPSPVFSTLPASL